MRLASLLFSGLVVAASGWAADPFVGNWKLNPDKSKGDEATLKGRIATIIRIEPAGANSYRETAEWRNPDGKTEESIQTTGWDGKDHVNDRTGDAPGTYTSSVQRIDNSHTLQIFKKNGKEYQRSETAISADGKLQTTHQWGTGRATGKPFDVILVYEEQ